MLTIQGKNNLYERLLEFKDYSLPQTFYIGQKSPKKFIVLIYMDGVLRIELDPKLTYKSAFFQLKECVVALKNGVNIKVKK